MNLSALTQSMTIAGAVLLVCAALVLILIFILSKKAVKPIAESYEKQKQFVTDANELKTPLTLILANPDIAESELGKNEWLDDIRAEGLRLTELVNNSDNSLSLDEYTRYASASTVNGFYYTITAYFNGSDTFNSIQSSSVTHPGLQQCVTKDTSL